jgi:hypothetical protein
LSGGAHHHSADLEMLEVVLPAGSRTVEADAVDAPAA